MVAKRAPSVASAAGMTSATPPRDKSLRGRRGQAMVEFALALPIFLIIVFAIIEFSIVLSDQIQLSYATREGARAGAIHFETNPVPIPDADRVSQATSAATGAAGALISCKLQSPTVTPKTGGNPQIISVSLQCAYSPVTPIGNFVVWMGTRLNLPTSLSSSATRYVEP